MGADYDSNGDGQIDSDALRYVAGESEASYVTRITTTLRSTIRDANTHFVSVEHAASTTSSPTTRTRPTPAAPSAPACSAAPTGSGAPRYTVVRRGGKNPIWNQYGHERMGWAVSTSNPAAP